MACCRHGSAGRPEQKLTPPPAPPSPSEPPAPTLWFSTRWAKRGGIGSRRSNAMPGNMQSAAGTAMVQCKLVLAHTGGCDTAPSLRKTRLQCWSQPNYSPNLPFHPRLIPLFHGELGGETHVPSTRPNSMHYKRVS